MAERIKLVELDFDVEALVKKTTEAYQRVDRLADSQRNLRKVNKELKSEIALYTKALKDAEKAEDPQAVEALSLKLSDLNKRYESNTKGIVDNQAQLKSQRVEYRNGLKAVEAYTQKNRQSLDIIKQTDGSIDQLSAAISNNVVIYRSLSKAQRENDEIGGKLRDLISEQREEYKGLQQEIGNTSVNVGNYQEDIEKALAAQDLFSGGLGGMIGKFTSLSQQEGGIKGFFKSTVAGLKGATKAALTFIATPIGAVIAAVVVLVGLFTAAISRNQDATDGMAKVWGGVKNVIEEVVGRAMKLVGALGKLLKGDFKGAASQATEAMSGMAVAIAHAYGEGQQLVQMQVDFEKATIAATVSQAKLTGELQRYMQVAEDDTLAFSERTAAAEKAAEVQTRLAEENLSLIQQEVDMVNLRIEQARRQGKLNRELLQEQADAQARLINAENEAEMTRLDNAQKRRKLMSDLYERDLDILIDGFDNQKTINEQRIADDTRTMQERVKLLEETRRLADESLAKQVATFESFSGKQIDINELIAESDAVVLREKIRGYGLSEIWEGRLLEVVRDRKSAVNDLQMAEKDLAKEQAEAAAAEAEAAVQFAQKEVDIWIEKNRSKLESDEAYTEESVKEEQKRLDTLYNKQLEQLERSKEAGLISEQDFTLEKLRLQNDYIGNVKQIEADFVAYKATKAEETLEAEQEQLEQQLELRRLQGENELTLQAEQLEKEYQLKIEAVRKSGEDTTAIEQEFAAKSAQINEQLQQQKLEGLQQATAGLAQLLGEETKAGKAAASASALISALLAANQAYSALAGIPVVGPVLGAAAAAGALTSGIQNVRKINAVDADVKAEKGLAIDIGGRRHSSGGTKFYGEDGTAFEAEAGEKMFILNRRASAQLAPGLSALNEAAGGRPLWHATNYLAEGGTVKPVSGSTVKVQASESVIDYDRLAGAIVSALQDMPNPVVGVEDIINKTNRYVEVAEGANL